MNRIRSVFQLVRLPNLFTAAADVLAGWFFVGAGTDRLGELGALVAASVCFYAGGVAFNDVVDAPRDARERPSRPIPSGAISRRAATLLAGVLLIAGLILCTTASPQAGRTGWLLVGCILAYDSVLKSTPLAPATMGMCRALNLFLGMSAASPLTTSANIFAAAVMCLYVASVTYFARTEAQATSAGRLRLGSAGVLAAVMSLVLLQLFLTDADSWYLLLVGVLLGQVTVARRAALMTREPREVQHAVKTFVMSIVILDACLVFAARGPMLAAVVLVLIVPATAIGSRVRTT